MSRASAHKPADVRGHSVLLLGNYRAAVAVARALSRSGYRVIAGKEGEPLGAHCSTAVDEHWDHPPLRDDADRFVVALKDLLEKRNDIGTVLPVTEEFVQFFAAREDAVPTSVTLASPGNDIIELFSDKLAALSLAQEKGVPTLPYACVSDYPALLREASGIGYPLTLRGLGATARLLGKKAHIFADADELAAAIPIWPDGHETLLLQGFASGVRRNLYFAARNGKIIGLAQSRIHRTNALDGTGLAVDGITETPDPQLVGDTEQLVAATRYTGIGLTQFIVDAERGERCFLELNPRVSGSHSVAEFAGLPLSRLAVELAEDRPSRSKPSEPVTMGRSGLRYAWSGGDLLAAKEALTQGSLPMADGVRWLWRAVKTAVSADCHMVWSWRDPGPGLITAFLILPRCHRVRATLRSWFAKGRTVSDAAPRSGDRRLEWNSRRPGASLSS